MKRKKENKKKKIIVVATMEDFRIHDTIGDLDDIGFLGQYSNV
jgi:hypothetical protein